VRKRLATVVAAAMSIGGTVPATVGAAPGDAITPGTAQWESTLNSIGVYWPVTNDVNRNATLTLEYRLAGSTSWLPGAPAMRAYPTTIVDGTALGLNHLAASAVLLRPDTSYELRATISDPDGGGSATTTTVTTTTEPVASPFGTTRAVVPGNGGGAGTAADPFRGLQAAANAANPGDIFEVAAGTYSPFAVTRSGTLGSPIVFRAAPGAAVVVDGAGTTRGVVTIGQQGTNTQHVIIEGLTIRNGAWGVDADSTRDITVRRNTIENVNFGVYNRREANVEARQYILDNVIVGRVPWPNTGIPADRGVDLRGSSNVVAYNTVRNFGDCISVQPLNGVGLGNDIVGNEASYCVDDGIEIDYNVANVRVWRNRVSNARMGVSTQPIKGGPAYIFRNELINLESSSIKLNNQPSGLVVVNNSAVKLDVGLTEGGATWRNVLFRNNAIAGTGYAFEFTTSPDDGPRDFDYNAWGTPRNGTSAEPRFKWNNVRYNTIADLRGAGVEIHGREITAAAFTNATLGATPATDIAPGSRDLRPASGSALVNGGVPMGNFDIGFVSDGVPDMGALEAGAAQPVYGPRLRMPPEPQPRPARFVAFGPARQLDTRNGEQGGRHPGALVVREYTLAALPPDATAATFTIAAVGPAASGFVNAIPCGTTPPTTASVTYQSDRYVTSNQVTVRVAGQKVCVVSSQAVDLTIDLAGWWVRSDGSQLASQQGRLLDSRETGGPSTLWRVDVSGRPAGTTAVSINLAAVAGPSGGFLTAYDCAIAPPVVATVNASPGLAVSTLGTIALSPSTTALCVSSNVPRDVTVDLIGWWSTSGSSGLSAFNPPLRALDTRIVGSPVGRLPAATKVQIVPSGAAVYFVNVSAVGADANGFVSVFSCEVAWPGTASVNMRAERAASNAAWVDAASGGICAYTNTSTHVVVDVFGSLTSTVGT
jgi:hypothetical protein